MLSLIEKASKLNRLRKIKFIGTPCESKTTIDKILEGYNRETNMIIDSLIWHLYGLHYKEYIDTELASCGMCTYDIVKLEKAIDKALVYWENEISELQSSEKTSLQKC